MYVCGNGCSQELSARKDEVVSNEPMFCSLDGQLIQKKWSNSLSPSFSLFSCVMTLGNFAYLMCLHIPVVDHKDIRNPVEGRIYFYIVKNM